MTHATHTHSVNQTLTVLTPRLTDRLAVVTEALRELSRDGFKVQYQDFRADEPGKRPLVVLHAGSAQLRKRMREVRTAVDGTQRRVLGQFLQVDLSWLEPLEAANA